MTPWVLLAALKRRWLVVAVLGMLLGSSAATAVWYFLPPGEHKVRREIYVESRDPYIEFPNKTGLDSATFNRMQMALIRNRMVLNVALRDPEVVKTRWMLKTEEPLVWLEKNLVARFDGGPEIMHIALEGEASEIPELTVLVDAVTKAYMSEVVEKDRQQKLARIRQLREIAGRYEKKLKDIQGSMRRLKEEAGTGHPENLQFKQRLALQEYQQASGELTRYRGEIRTLKSQLAHLGATGKPEITASESEIEAIVNRDPRLMELAAEVERLKLDEAGAVATSADPDRSPTVRKLRKELAATQAELAERRKTLRAEAEPLIEEAKGRGFKVGELGLRQRLAYLESVEKILVKDVERLHKESEQIKLNTLDLEDFQYDLKQAETMLTTLNGTAERLTVETEARPRVRPWGKEAIVTRPDEQARKIKYSALAGVGLFGLVALCVGLLEVRARRVEAPADVVQQLGMPVVAHLPYYKHHKHGPREALRLKEAVDNARTLLLHVAENNHLKTVMVASATAGEGKTSLCCHLAASLARAGRSTLLLDADLRKPDAHNVFGLPATPGLSEVLRGECPAHEAVQDTGMPGLHLLSAGSYDDEVLRYIAREGLGSTLAHLRETYDFVILDTSPVLAVPDALILCNRVDGVLFSVMQGETRADSLAAASARVGHMDAAILGVIVNGSRDQDHSAYYEYSYRYTPSRPASGEQHG